VESAPLSAPRRTPIPARVPDPFAILGLPARPWLDAAALQSAFHRLGALHHPDSPGGATAAFAAVNSAWQALRDPAQRLRHLLEIHGHTPTAGAAAIPPALADTFMGLAALRTALDRFLARHTAASGALAQALLASERTDLTRRLREALAHLEASRAQSHDTLRALDAAWDARDATTLAHLATLQQSLAFQGKWSDQLREGLFQLGA